MICTPLQIRTNYFFKLLVIKFLIIKIMRNKLLQLFDNFIFFSLAVGYPNYKTFY
jgi:hypothetical protein